MAGRVRRRVVGAAVVALAWLGVAAPPAGAHSTDAPPASDYHTVVAGLRPGVPGVTVGTGPDLEQLEVHVDGDRTVVVLGYQDEPYLRVDRRGVFENSRSPAVALNRTRVPTEPAPKGPARPPRWVKVSDGTTARWHDHRSHWMGGATPEVVRDAPDRSHVISRWTVPVRVDGRPTEIHGRVVWDPPPTAWAWYLLALGLAVAVLAAARVRARATFAATAALLALGEVAHVWGSWSVSGASTWGRLGASIPSLAAVVVNAFVAWRLLRRSVWSNAPGLLIAGLFAVVAGGFADLPVLSRSWLPTDLDPTLARFLVAWSLGGGAALVVGGLTRLRARNPAAPADDAVPEPAGAGHP